jgi:hypothetical protein
VTLGLVGFAEIERKEPPDPKKAPIKPPKTRKKPIGDPPPRKAPKRVALAEAIGKDICVAPSKV